MDPKLIAKMIRKTCSATILTSIGCLLLAMTGCGNGLAHVEGKITFNGKPIAEIRQADENKIYGTVSFQPESGTGPSAIGSIDESGRYQVKTGTQSGIAPGAYLVSVSATELIPPKIEGTPGSGRSITPPRYSNPKTSGFRAEVSTGSNEFDFDLSAAP